MEAMPVKDQISPELYEKIRLKYKIKIHYNPEEVKTIYIKEVIDEKEVVFKWWSKHKQRWVYHIEHAYYFEYLFRAGKLQFIKACNQQKVINASEQKAVDLMRRAIPYLKTVNQDAEANHDLPGEYYLDGGLYEIMQDTETIIMGMKKIIKEFEK